MTWRGGHLPHCWICGQEIDKGCLIEWQRGYEKQLVCDKCLGMCVRNEKKIEILADISLP